MAVTSSLAAPLLITLVTLYLSLGAAGEQSVTCPIRYNRHSIEDIRSKAKLPYLLGGIYDEGRRCPNCRRGGLWSDFCGFKNMEKSTFWQMQLCKSSTVGAAVDAALKQDNAAELLTMTPCDFWPYMRGRTTWIIGDSMSKDLFKALRCFMVEFQDLKTYHASNNFTAMHYLHSIPGQGEPHCAHMPDNTRLCQIHAIEGDLFVASNGTEDRTRVGGVLPLIQQHLANPEALFIVHFGLWHGETRQDAYKRHLHALGRFYNSTKDKFPHMFFMETPKQHFDSEDGDYKVPWITTRKGPWTCQPIKGVSLAPDGHLKADQDNTVAQYVARGSWRNQHAREILAQYDIPLIPIYNVTVPAWDFHRDNLVGHECSHFCHPSLPQFWLWNLLTVLRQQKVPPVEDPYKIPLHSGCAITYEWEEAKFGNPVPTTAMLDEHERQRSFWDWLFGRNKFVLQDGVLVPVQGGGSSKRADALTPWEGLQKLLVRQEQQDKQEDIKQQQPAATGSKKDDQSVRPPKPAATKVQQENRRKEAVQERGSRPRQQRRPRPGQQERGSRHQQQPLQQQHQQSQQQRQRHREPGKQQPGREAEPTKQLVEQHLRKKQQQQQGRQGQKVPAYSQQQQQQQAGD